MSATCGQFRQKTKTRNKSFISKLAVCVGFCFFALGFSLSSLVQIPTVQAATGINRMINYQGRLMDSTGNAVTDGTYKITFRLYTQSSGGSHIWSASTTNGLPTGTATSVNVTVHNGLFSVLLGDAGQNSLSSVDFNQDTLYLGVKVAADNEMTPRKRLSSVPYAFNAEALQGQHASATVNTWGGNVFSLTQNSANSATSSRSALFIKTSGTSNANDFLIRGNNGSDVFTVTRQGNVTTTGNLQVSGNTLLGGLLSVSATSTLADLTLNGRVDSNLLPFLSNAYDLGSLTYRWRNLYATNVYASGTVQGSTAIFGNATTTNLFNSGVVSTTQLFVNGVAVTGAGPTPSWQQVTDAGATSNHWLQFAGATSTSDFRPSTDNAYSLGLANFRWKGVFAVGVTTTWLGATTVSTTNLFVNGQSVTSSVPTLNQVANKGNVTSKDIQFGGGTSTSDFRPLTSLAYDLGSSSNRWKDVWASSTRIGTSTWELWQANQGFTISRGLGNRYVTVANNGNVGIGITAPEEALDVKGNIQNVLHENQDFSTIATTTITASATGGRKVGKYLYFGASGGSQLIIFDASNPKAPIELSANDFSFTGVTDNPAIIGDYLFLPTSYSSELMTIDVSNPVSPILVNTYTSLSSIQDVEPYGKHLLVADSGNNRLVVLDVTNPINPAETATLATGIYPIGLDVQGGYAYTANNGDGTMSIIDMTNPSAPMLVTSILLSVGYSPRDVKTVGNYAFVVGANGSGDGEMFVIDVTNPTSPAVVSDQVLMVGEGISKITISGRYAYLVDNGSARITVMDIFDPTTPVLIKSISGNGFTGAVVDGRYVYAPDYANVLNVIDIQGTETNGLMAHSAEIGSLSVLNGATFSGQLIAQTSVVAGSGGILSLGGLGVYGTSTLSDLKLSGRIDSDLLPNYTNTYGLGSSAYLWKNLFASNVSSTNIDALGYVSTTNLYVNGTQITGGAPNLQQVTLQGNTTTLPIYALGNLYTKDLNATNTVAFGSAAMPAGDFDFMATLKSFSSTTADLFQDYLGSSSTYIADSAPFGGARFTLTGQNLNLVNDKYSPWGAELYGQKINVTNNANLFTGTGLDIAMTGSVAAPTQSMTGVNISMTQASSANGIYAYVNGGSSAGDLSDTRGAYFYVTGGAQVRGVQIDAAPGWHGDASEIYGMDIAAQPGSNIADVTYGARVIAMGNGGDTTVNTSYGVYAVTGDEWGFSRPAIGYGAYIRGSAMATSVGAYLHSPDGPQTFSYGQVLDVGSMSQNPGGMSLIGDDGSFKYGSFTRVKGAMSTSTGSYVDVTTNFGMGTGYGAYLNAAGFANNIALYTASGTVEIQGSRVRTVPDSATGDGDLYVKNDMEIDGGLLLGDGPSDTVIFNSLVDSDLSPYFTDTYSLGSNSNRWKNLFASNVSSTNMDALGYVSTTNLYVNGTQITGATPTLQQVTTAGRYTDLAIGVGGVSSTGSILPTSNLAYDLGSSSNRWKDIWASSTRIGTSTWELWQNNSGFVVSKGLSNRLFTISNAGSPSFSASGAVLQVGGTTSGAGGRIRTKEYASYSGTIFGVAEATDSGTVATKFTFRGPVNFNNGLRDASDNARLAFSATGYNIVATGTTRIVGTLNVTATTTLKDLALSGRVASDLSPFTNLTHSLGSSSYKWKNLFVGSVSSTNIYNTGTVSTTYLYVNGQQIQGGLSTLQTVTNNGKTTTNDIQFAGGTSTRRFAILGSADQSQLLVRANATQSITNPLIVLQDSAGVELARLNTNNYQNIFAGYNSGNSVTTGSGLAFFGENSGQGNTTGNYNTAIGSRALYMNTSTYSNTAVGREALYNLKGGSGTNGSNVALGYKALYTDASGYYNTAIGTLAINLANSSNNTAVGYRTFDQMTTGGNNTALGYAAGWSGTAVTTEINGLFVGYGAGLSAAGVNKATAIGYNARVGSSDSIVLGGTGADAVNVGIGDATPTEGKLVVAGSADQSQLVVKANGTQSNTKPLIALTDSGGTVLNTIHSDSMYNQFMGVDTGRNNAGTSNTFIGYQAGYTNGSGYQLVALGGMALYSNTTGFDNTALGISAMRNNTTGFYNVAVGDGALWQNTTGIGNVAVGHLALEKNVSPTTTVAIGGYAAYGLSSYHSQDGVYIGYGAGSIVTTGADNNTMIGFDSGNENTSGANNVFIGYGSGDAITTGSNNTMVGYGAYSTTGAVSNSMALGAGASVTSSNIVRVGNSSITSIGGYRPWSNLSDIRIKHDINDSSIGLPFVRLLKSKTFKMNGTDDVRDGFIAQDVLAAMTTLGTGFSGLDDHEVADGGYYYLDYSAFVVPLTNAVKTLDLRTDKLAQGLEIANGFATGTKYLTVDGNGQLAYAGAMVKAEGQASTSTQGYGSGMFTLQGSGWDSVSSTAVTTNFKIFNRTINATTSELVIGYSTGTNEVSNFEVRISNLGDMNVAGDVTVGKRLFLGNKTTGVGSTSTYIFVDDTLAPTSTYIATNADGWQASTAYDYAERYVSDQALQPGDVVAMDQSGVNKVKLATGNGEPLIGIVSTKPGFITGAHQTSTYPIALAGRVPTKVSTANGAIRVGDYLTVSSRDGVAMKATKSGEVVGIAFEAYEKAEDGVISVFVKPQQVTFYGPEPISGPVNPTINTTVRTGLAKIMAGSNSVNVKFQTLGAFPVVSVTPYGQTPGGYWIEQVTDSGFTLVLAQPTTIDLTVGYTASLPTETAVSVSDNTQSTLDAVTGQTVSGDQQNTSGMPQTPSSTSPVTTTADQSATGTSPGVDLGVSTSTGQ